MLHIATIVMFFKLLISVLTSIFHRYRHKPRLVSPLMYKCIRTRKFFKGDIFVYAEDFTQLQKRMKFTSYILQDRNRIIKMNVNETPLLFFLPLTFAFDKRVLKSELHKGGRPASKLEKIMLEISNTFNVL